MKIFHTPEVLFQEGFHWIWKRE